MDPQTRREIERLHRDLARLRAQVPVRMPPSAVATPVKVVEIIGGQDLGGGYLGIVYAPSVTPAAVYDPDVDTDYPDGLGNAWLWIDGVRQANRVLARHDGETTQYPLAAGHRARVRGTETLTYSGTDMTVYTVRWE